MCSVMESFLCLSHDGHYLVQYDDVWLVMGTLLSDMDATLVRFHEENNDGDKGTMNGRFLTMPNAEGGQTEVSKTHVFMMGTKAR